MKFGWDAVPLHNLKSNQLAQLERKEGRNCISIFSTDAQPSLRLKTYCFQMEFVNVIPRDQQQSKAKELLDRVGVASLAKKFPHTLSGGEKQRVAIARALANNPDLIVADEPTGNIDTENTAIIHSLFNTLVKEGKDSRIRNP